MASITTSLMTIIAMLSVCSTNAFTSEYCLPGENCWPGMSDIMKLNDSLVGTVLLPRDLGYYKEGVVKDTYYSSSPAIIVKVASLKDVQNTLMFAKKYLIRLTIFSSGHEYNGRSTADGSLQMTMSLMEKIDINLKDVASDTGASITVETGNSWARIYQEADKARKVVVGGACHTVSPGGYTAGGGYGALSRSLGLAADNVIAITLVLADGNVAYLNSSGTTIKDKNGQILSTSADTGLFWAIRGGGPGTFGIVINYTFKLHEPPTQLVEYIAGYPMDFLGDTTQGKEVITFIHILLSSLPNEWGGYLMHVPTSQYVPIVHGMVSVQMLHYGPWDTASRRAIETLVNFHPERQISSTFINHTSFWSYIKNKGDNPFFRGYVANSLLPETKLTPDLAEFYLDFVLNQTSPISTFRRCTDTMIGGKVSEPNDNAVSTDFRHAMLLTTCYLSWSDPRNDSAGAALGKKLADNFYKFSQGVYLNEAAYDLPNWRTDFWGQNYNRLSTVKKQWDPNNVFDCRHCIGDESGGDETDVSVGMLEGSNHKHKLVELMEQSIKHQTL